MKIVRICSLYLLIILLASFAGCGQNAEKDEGYRIYYLNKEITKIIPRSYEPAAGEEDVEAMIQEFIQQLTSDSGDVEFVRTISDNVKVLDFTLEETLLTLYFSNEYNAVDSIEEALARAAIVRTMTQIEGVECLSFYVGDTPLLDKSGNPIGVMTDDSFVENPGEQINSIQTAVLTLYFANQKGNGLVTETQEIHYSSNISMEKLVMEHLLEGPESEDAQAAIPAGTKLINASVLDGVCYVSLDESFLKQNYNIEESIVIYSIVNSLSEISTINKVQISVNGDTNGVYRDSFRFDELYERNLDYVAK